MCALPSLNIRWVFKNTPPSSQSLVHAVYGVGCHTGQTGPFRHELQRRIAQKIFKPQKNAKVRLAAGVNLPTTHVIVRDLTFQGTDPLPVDQLVQMAGRAGRGDKRGHAFFVHRKNDAWKIERLLTELKEPPFPELSSALRGVGGRFKPQDRERLFRGLLL
jgi:replicative superfamily II helicase